MISSGGTLKAQATVPSRPTWLPPIYYGIAMCEEGMNWRIRGPKYETAFGMAASTYDGWKPDGFPENGGDATPQQQFQVARNVAERGVWKHGKYTAPVGFTAWGSYRSGCYRSYM